MHQKAQNRATQRKSSKVGDSIKLGSVYKTKPKRKPRSMLEIRESLRIMMENELIEIENKKLKKKLKAKQAADPNTGRTSQRGPTSRSVDSQDLRIIKMPEESRAVQNAKPSLANAGNGSSRKKRANLANSVANATDDEKGNNGQIPVLVTELSRETQDIQQNLPMIREEKTQEEIILHPPNHVPNNGGKEDTHGNLHKDRSSDSSFKDEIPTKLEQPSEFKINLKNEAHIITPKSMKRKSPVQQSMSPKPKTISPKPKSFSPKPKSISPKLNSSSPKPKSSSPLLNSLTPTTPSSDISQLKANVPKLPAINVEQITDDQTNIMYGNAAEDGVRMMYGEVMEDSARVTTDNIQDDKTPHGEKTTSDHWQTPMKFVNERIQNRLVVLYFVIISKFTYVEIHCESEI